jgi:glycosyltransferase involved in cell wall biosynthesis
VKILFVHSGPELTGSWTYAKALAREWAGRHEVFWVHDGMVGADEPSLRLPISRKLVPSGLANGQKLAAFVRQHQISILHSHSRRANMVAAMASRLTAVPYVTTAHLCMTPHVFNRIWPCFGHRTIAICENVQENLMAEHGVPADRISLIRNGIDLETFRPRASPAGPWRWITVLGRLSGHRWRAGAFVLSLIGDLLPDYPDVRFRFIGSVEPSHQQEMKDALDRLNAGYREPRVLAPGFLGDIQPLLTESTAVIAAGRSLMEAMALERPVIAVGEEFALGLLTPRNIQPARESNFGDFRKGPDRTASYDKAAVVKDLRSVLDKAVDLGRLGVWGREQVDLNYNIESVARAVETVYDRLLTVKAAL